MGALIIVLAFVCSSILAFASPSPIEEDLSQQSQQGAVLEVPPPPSQPSNVTRTKASTDLSQTSAESESIPKEKKSDNEPKGPLETWTALLLGPLVTIVSISVTALLFFRKARMDKQSLERQIKSAFDQLQITSHNAMVAAFANDDRFQYAIRTLANPKNTTGEDLETILSTPGIRVLLALKETDIEKQIRCNFCKCQQSQDENGEAAKNLQACVRKLLSPNRKEDHAEKELDIKE